jgi:steroid Delta-isomerase
MNHHAVRTTSSQDPKIKAIVQLFEQLCPEHLAQLGQYYDANVWFKDPFNETQGLAAVQGIFSHMFATLQRPHFRVQEVIAQTEQCFLSWHFLFSFKSSPDVEHTIKGSSHLQFDTATGLITKHRDYWDAAEELYEKIPLLKHLMCWLKKRVNAA